MPARNFDWSRRCSYDAHNKDAFHRAARARLKELAAALDLPEGSYEIRSNKGGIAVSGEVTLHGEDLYIQASQPVAGSTATGLMFRRCEGRRDYVGGSNNFASLASLDNPQSLAVRIRKAIPELAMDDANLGAAPGMSLR